jgi:hypothetical protein
MVECRVGERAVESDQLLPLAQQDDQRAENEKKIVRMKSAATLQWWCEECTAEENSSDMPCYKLVVSSFGCPGGTKGHTQHVLPAGEGVSCSL